MPPLCAEKLTRRQGASQASPSPTSGGGFQDSGMPEAINRSWNELLPGFQRSTPAHSKGPAVSAEEAAASPVNQASMLTCPRCTKSARSGVLWTPNAALKTLLTASGAAMAPQPSRREQRRGPSADRPRMPPNHTRPRANHWSPIDSSLLRPWGPFSWRAEFGHETAMRRSVSAG